jgi:hypothetical protein
MGVEALGVDYANMELADAGRALEGQVETARGVFAEHQVLPIGESEGLLVGSLYCGLYCGAQCCFGVIDDRCQR